MNTSLTRLLAALLLMCGWGTLVTGAAAGRGAPAMRRTAARDAPAMHPAVGRDAPAMRPGPAGEDPRARAGASSGDAPEGEAGQPGAEGADEPPADAEPAAPLQKPYRPVQLEVGEIIWLDPGQRGLIEAHPLVMGLAAMALATVTLLFFFLRGIKRPRDEEL